MCSMHTSLGKNMEASEFEFTEEQRRVLDRYSALMKEFLTTHDKANLALDRRAKSGHQWVHLFYDSRLNNAAHDEQSLNRLWQQVQRVSSKVSSCAIALDVFSREAAEVTALTSRNTPVDQVDFSYFTLSPIWSLYTPRNLKQMVAGFGGMFYEAKGDLISIDSSIDRLYVNSIGLKSIFAREMASRSCECHAQPTVVPLMFGELDTTPRWDFAYSSSDPAVRAREYVADVTQLFNDFTSVATRVEFVIEEIAQSLDRVRVELADIHEMNTMGRLNLKLAFVRDDVEASLSKLTALEKWLK